MEEKKYVIPDSGYVSIAEEERTRFPKPRIIKSGRRNKDYAPIEVKRTIRPGVHRLNPGESVDWQSMYD